MLSALDKLTFDTLLDYSCTAFKNNRLSSKVGEASSFTYDDFYHHVKQISQILKEQGITQGDKVALLSENSPYWSMAYFAITSMGAVVVPILVDFHPNEIKHIISHSRSKALFVSEKYVDILDDSFSSHLLEFVVNLDTITLSEIDSQKSILKDEKSLLHIFKEKFIHKNEKDLTITEDDLAAIIYTSGTTGQSKGVMLSHKNLVSQVIIAENLFDLFESDRLLSVLPMAHTFEFSIGFLVPFYNGSSIAYISKAPTPSVLMSAFEEIKPTFLLFVPLIIEKLFKNKILPNLQKNSLMRSLYKVPFFRKKLHKIAGKKLHDSFGGEVRFLGIGGSKLSQFVEEFLHEANFPYAIGYGLTETSPLTLAAMPNQTKIGSCGYDVYKVETKLDYSASSSEGEGELLIKGINVMIGYFDDKARTEESLEDGWYRTGDLARKESDGRVFITGRSKNVIIGSSGENIYPESLESVINQHPYVSESLVYDNETKVTARIYLNYELIDKEYNSTHEDSQMHIIVEKILEDIRIYTNQNVASYAKIIKVIEQREPFVMTPTKKIKRFLYTD